MRIDKKLNLVLTMESDGRTYYVHSTPVPRMVFETYFLPISLAFAELFSRGAAYVMTAGPRIGAMLLKKVAVESGTWEGEGGVEKGLMAEIRRLTNVVIPSDTGWATLPLQVAIGQKHISEDDLADIEGAIVFFICASAMHRRDQLAEVLDGMRLLWGARFEFLNCTEFAASLPISTETEISPPPATVLSVPS